MSNSITAPLTIVHNIISAPITLGIIGGSGASSWDDLTGKPLTFEPSTHTHPPSAITGTALTLSGEQTITGVKTFGAEGPAVFDGSSATFNGSGVYFSTGSANFDGTSAANFNIGSSATFNGSGVYFSTGSANFDGTSSANFANGSSINLADGVNWSYTATAKTEHLTALGGTTVGRSLFTTTNASTAWTALGGAGTITTPTFTTVNGVTGLVLAYAFGSNTKISLMPSGLRFNTNNGYQVDFDNDGFWPSFNQPLGKSGKPWGMLRCEGVISSTTASSSFGGPLAVTGASTLTGNVTTAGFIAGSEMTAPSAPAANGYRIFAEDNGSGKTRLMVQFATGSAVQLAIQP
jgi:hypothetical protein